MVMRKVAPPTVAVEEIRVGAACPLAGEQYSKEKHGWWCTRCEQTVHNLSAMTEAEAEGVVSAAGGALCVAYEVGKMGGRPRWIMKRDR